MTSLQVVFLRGVRSADNVIISSLFESIILKLCLIL